MRPPFLLAACLVSTSCQDADPPPAARAEAELPAPADPPSDEQAPEPEDPWQTQLAARVLTRSGLAPGSTLISFDAIAPDGETHCPLSDAGAMPKVLAVGAHDDEAFLRDLQDLDAIVHKYEGTLTAFAVLLELDDGMARSARDPQVALEHARELTRVLDLGIPLVVPVSEPGQRDTWAEYYNVTTSRTVMLADDANTVVFAKVTPEDWSELDAAFRRLLASATG
jgi:hypothetical protein